MNRSASPVGIAASSAAVVVALGLVTAVAASTTDLPGAPAATVVVADLAAGWAFGLLGAFLWVRYPRSTVGPLALAVGLASFLADIRWFGTPVPWTVGSMATDLHLVVLAWLILAFPDGGLETGERAFVVALATYFVALAVAGHLFQDPVPDCATCPESLLLLRRDPVLNGRIWQLGQFVNLAAVGVLVGLVVRRWSAASTPARRTLAPVMWALGPIGLTLAAAFVEPLVGFGPGGAEAVLVAERLALVAFPVALLIGMLRSRLARGTVADLAHALEEVVDHERLERLVAEALGDPSARLAFWSVERNGLIDASGAVFSTDDDRRVTAVERLGEPLGAIVHDPHVDPSMVEAVGAAAGLALHNERLRAELRRHLAEVEASRERIAEAAIAERRRLERDLHDGAQQRLLALGTLLGRIRARVDAGTGDLVDEAVAELRSTADDLRELARGIHPSILSERGLAAAIGALAERVPVPVEVDLVTERCRPAAEAAAYFLVSEALTNAARHAGASSVRVVARTDDGALRVSITDDGRGGADPARGTGLAGLADRFEALGGTVTLSSPAGGGTTVEGRMPCG